MPGSVLGGLTGNARCCCGLTKWMNRMVVCRSAMKAQMEEWKEDQGRLQEEVIFNLDLVRKTEIKTCYFKL